MSYFDATVWDPVRWVPNKVVIEYDPNHTKVGEYARWNLSTLVRFKKYMPYVNDEVTT